MMQKLENSTAAKREASTPAPQPQPEKEYEDYLPDGHDFEFSDENL